MSPAKEAILERIRNGLKDVPEDEFQKLPPIDRGYQQTGGLSAKERIIQFAGRLSEYRATVTVINEQDLSRAVGEACIVQNVKRLVVPAGLPAGWIPENPDNPEVIKDAVTGGKPLTYRELDESQGVLTGCALAVAQTGTIILKGGPAQGRRVLTLLPDFHLCVVYAEQIVGIIPEAFSKLEKPLLDSGPPVTFISGPSATSDIELSRVEGVHGPRRLHVVIVEN
ncbi:MAG: LUD domain-containing protein [Balneolaceae bacterium]